MLIQDMCQGQTSHVGQADHLSGVSIWFIHFSVFIDHSSGCGCCEYKEKLVMNGECPDKADTDLCCCDGLMVHRMETTTGNM